MSLRPETDKSFLKREIDLRLHNIVKLTDYYYQSTTVGNNALALIRVNAEIAEDLLKRLEERNESAE